MRPFEALSAPVRRRARRPYLYICQRSVQIAGGGSLKAPQRAFKLRSIISILLWCTGIAKTIADICVAIYDGVQKRGIVDVRKIGSGWPRALVRTGSDTGEGW